MIVNDVCVCSHTREHHTKYRLINGSFRGYCITCFAIKSQNPTDHLHEYKPDNLIFLEEIAYQKGFEQYSIAKKSRARKYYNR